MTWVLIAADAYSFLIAWELMALSSYFLIVAFKATQETQHAGFLYFLIAHIGALAILFSFALMLQDQTDFSFDAMRHAQLSTTVASHCIFISFSRIWCKSRVIAFSCVAARSASCSSFSHICVNERCYVKNGCVWSVKSFFDFLVNATSDLGNDGADCWIINRFIGCYFSCIQTDMKRFLAYSSIENIGFITAGLGLALLFNATNHSQLAALTLVAVLFHCFNHALFKSVLFLGTGSVLHATGERNLGRLGGLFSQCLGPQH